MYFMKNQLKICKICKACICILQLYILTYSIRRRHKPKRHAKRKTCLLVWLPSLMRWKISAMWLYIYIYIYIYCVCLRRIQQFIFVTSSYKVLNNGGRHVCMYVCMHVCMYVWHKIFQYQHFWLIASFWLPRF